MNIQIELNVPFIADVLDIADNETRFPMIIRFENDSGEKFEVAVGHAGHIPAAVRKRLPYAYPDSFVCTDGDTVRATDELDRAFAISDEVFCKTEKTYLHLMRINK